MNQTNFFSANVPKKELLKWIIIKSLVRLSSFIKHFDWNMQPVYAPSWIIKDMHVTSQMGSRNTLILKSSDQNELETRLYDWSQIGL